MPARSSRHRPTRRRRRWRPMHRTTPGPATCGRPSRSSAFSFSSIAPTITSAAGATTTPSRSTRSGATCAAAGVPTTIRSRPISSAIRSRERCTSASRARRGSASGNRPPMPSPAARYGRSPARRLAPRATTRSRAASAAPSSAKRCFACRASCSSRAVASRRSGARWRQLRSTRLPASTDWPSPIRAPSSRALSCSRSCRQSTTPSD